MRVASKEDDGPRRATIEAMCAGLQRLAEDVVLASIANEWTIPDLLEVTTALVNAEQRIKAETQRRISVGNTGNDMDL
jgi:hypothetical protein